MSRLFSFLVLSFVLLMPMAYAVEKDTDDKILDPKEWFNEDEDTSMVQDDKSLMHEDHSEDKDVAPDHDEEVMD